MSAQQAAALRGTRWRSWQLHVATFAPGALETVLTEAVGPLADRLGLLEADGPPWFFLRYWQGGPHLRLRLGGLTEAEAASVESELARRLRTLDAAVPGAQRIDQEGYRRAVRPLAAAGEAGNPLPAGDLLAPGLHRTAYEPEYARYGGRQLIGRSEQLFHRSSQVALRVCLARAGVRHGLVSGLEATAAALSVLSVQDGEPATAAQVRFLTVQRDLWLDWAQPADAPAGAAAESRRQLVEDAAKQVSALSVLGPRLRATLHGGDPCWASWTDPLKSGLQTWTTELGPARAMGIFGSHVHMTANRLGVGAGREAHLAQLLLALLGPLG
ncbi:lantibiotic dehydratase C-terminal domain-containing protein [Streptacidiphilus sp. PAMC 29251]